MAKFKNTVMFGGAGFIGRHFARHLLSRELSDRVYLCDIVEPDLSGGSGVLQSAFDEGRIKFLRLDVRKPILHPDLPPTADLVVNLAAIHREPGHQHHEYFETNLLGADNVCEWTRSVGCPRLVFTSSIAPYGPTEEERDENSLPTPTTAYGASKLTAEKIHVAWQREAGDSRSLVVVRSGVVFGPGENGNVTRMIRAVLGRYFVYMGNRKTRKAGGYVKELCETIEWTLGRQAAVGERISLYNFTMSPPPTIEEFVRAIGKVAGVRPRVPTVPYTAVSLAARLLWTFGLIRSFHPVRVRKLVRSNNVAAVYLHRAGYRYHYTLESALADWRDERPDEWRR